MSTPDQLLSHKRCKITLIDDKIHEDGTHTVNYVLDHDALELCAKEYEKDMKKLTEEEIHNFVMKNLGAALKGHDEWIAKKTVDLARE